MREPSIAFPLVQMDGIIGTSNRYKAFHDVAWQNIKDAGFSDLRGKLLLIVGEFDTNVDPSSTLQVARALRLLRPPFEEGQVK